MTITSTSTMADIIAAHPVTLTTDQQASLTSITLTNTSIIKVGLASIDLATFKADCATATACTATTYTAYDGYALYGMLSDGKTKTDRFGACFADKTCFTIDPAATDNTNYAYNTIKLSAAASKTVPKTFDTAVADKACESNTGGFHAECFAFTASAVTGKAASAWRFVKNTDATFKVGAITEVVGIDATNMALGTNVIASVTLELAAALVSAATVAGSVAFSLLI